MASREIIDLTEPEVIELDSDGEEVDARPSTNGSPLAQTTQADDLPQQGQTKKKRRKKKRKASAAAQPYQDEQAGTTTTSAEVSRPQSPDRQDEPEITEVDMEPGQIQGAKSSHSQNRSLAERLSGPAEGSSRSAANGEGRRRGQKDGETKPDAERGKEREKDRKRERERRRRSRSPQRDRDRVRDRNRDARRRSRSRERDGEKRSRDKASERNAPLFFEDVTPAEVPAAAKLLDGVAGPSRQSGEARSNTLSSTESQAANGLLLPTHVSVAEGAEAEALELGPLAVPTPEVGSDEEDYIDYLDYDDNLKPGMVRYWELDKLEAEVAKASKPARIVCKKCGAEGEHKTYECTVLICLICGARNEHPTRSCPISKVCFTCGMKGHINKTCPNRGKSGAYQGFQDCDRCGARTHQTNECPTLWRLYKYVEDEDRQEILRVRETKRVLAFGEGGEGYIATDEWCYNCGECGHLGDDCKTVAHPFDMPHEPSAFSLYNILSGPFSSEALRSSKRAPRDWETASAFADGHGATLPTDVGRQGRRKERERLGKAQLLQDAEDEEDDWFGSAHSRARSDARASREGGRNGGRGKAEGKVKFNFSSGASFGGGEKEGKRQRTSYNDLPGPSRETDTLQIRGASRKQSYSSTSSKDRHDRHTRDRNRNRYEEMRESQRGPRYRGGYR
ncbi:hypothetical protein BD309DRAFT_961038 [Dichomitus squalens]|uniref:Uncharacterized protein n=1 Tax=Dichomitus squalens TaxID=114155 RepID=A0A4Q9Q833_9APHY|nr:hypothetical protein BD309DRAFT_961038 [Dichomitus squalens]TBU63340.1 hypothetical protein BD310DRAFT_842311 [Dichomitus squalens]